MFVGIPNTTWADRVLQVLPGICDSRYWHRCIHWLEEQITSPLLGRERRGQTLEDGSWLPDCHVPVSVCAHKDSWETHLSRRRWEDKRLLTSTTLALSPSFQLSTLTNCLGLTMERILFTDSPSERPSKSMKANEHLWHVPITIPIELCYYRPCVW